MHARPSNYNVLRQLDNLWLQTGLNMIYLELVLPNCRVVEMANKTSTSAEDTCNAVVASEQFHKALQLVHIAPDCKPVRQSGLRICCPVNHVCKHMQTNDKKIKKTRVSPSGCNLGPNSKHPKVTQSAYLTLLSTDTLGTYFSQWSCGRNLCSLKFQLVDL